MKKVKFNRRAWLKALRSTGYKVTRHHNAHGNKYSYQAVYKGKKK